jgi:hypothetical protein
VASPRSRNQLPGLRIISHCAGRNSLHVKKRSGRIWIISGAFDVFAIHAGNSPFCFRSEWGKPMSLSKSSVQGEA